MEVRALTKGYGAGLEAKLFCGLFGFCDLSGCACRNSVKHDIGGLACELDHFSHSFERVQIKRTWARRDQRQISGFDCFTHCSFGVWRRVDYHYFYIVLLMRTLDGLREPCRGGGW